MNTKNLTEEQKAQQRVLIAKDVIERIRKDQFLASSGGFVEVFQNESLLKEGTELKTILPEIKCQVCAKGALFLSFIGCYNEYKISKNEEKETALNVHNSQIYKRLKDIFTKKQYDMIETAFELTVYPYQGASICKKLNKGSFFETYVSTPLGQQCMKFGGQFGTDRSRLEGIMENIIKNKGEFKP